ncbi:glyoxalase [Flavobacterium cyanobacteriorum]|uniref:Glyoxalase n=1 Tax=Flavobacterium cyanobacteriorum TaxID=2022802 RepID=A0A255Z5Y4_9FLAO|nr:VOC family protein [Flavobacterium cyanobacteriorum]OYQ36888.1 glyoxalase [Flavobacterium cyanobacteriorum]
MKNIWTLILPVTVVLLISCGNEKEIKRDILKHNNTLENTNPVIYFEIPVTDIKRAKQFYAAVFGFTFEDEVIDGNTMALFPFSKQKTGISGALAKGDIYKPTTKGILVYFATQDIDATLNAALQNGAKVLYPKTSNGDLGYVAEFQDTEGNRIALHQAVD